MPRYMTPGGRVYTLFDSMTETPHLLIAGATGTGKSVIINGIIYNLLHKGPSRVQLVLIDPKKVELAEYRKAPHCIAYASNHADIIAVLENTVQFMNARYTDMQRRGVRQYEGADVYVIIDELADIMTTSKKQVAPLLQRLTQLGRAARVHVIAATQCALASVAVPTPIKINFTSVIGLRVRSATDSRSIIGQAGCETLPQYGQAYYQTPTELHRIMIPMYPEADVKRLAHYWTSNECIA